MGRTYRPALGPRIKAIGKGKRPRIEVVRGTFRVREELNRCMNCSTPIPREERYCPGCKEGMRVSHKG
jgi:predicted amidophosphoribosyltransferase